MDSKRWQQVKAIFEEAVELPPADRESFVRESAGSDDEIFEEAMALLKADERPHSMLDRGAADQFEEISGIDLTGSTVGAWRVLERIASGGMGAVYLAERADGQYQQRVALKVIRKGMDSEDILQRFSSERQILARLEHPNIARLIDGGMTESGQPYFTMEYVDGEPITEYCDREEATIDRRLALFRKACAAVQYAHQNLVVHRDLKPSNVLVDRNGTVKLVDFGIAKVLGGASGAEFDPQLTQTGFRVMTPAYASPEQVRGEAITTASDVYSLGVVFYELLTGNRPFQVEGRSPAQIENEITDVEPARPSTAVSRQEDGEALSVRSADRDQLRRKLTGDLDNICLMALRKEPDRRYPSAGQLGDDLERYERKQPVVARPDTWSYRVSKFVSRNRTAVVAATIVVLIVAGIIGFYTARLAAERDRAQLEAEKARQVADFVIGLFSAADPDESVGREITARELLDSGAVHLERELADQPEVRATMEMVIADVYDQLSLMEQALHHARTSLDLSREVLGPDHPTLAAVHRQLGTIFYNLGTYDSSIYHSRQTLRIDSLHFSDNDTLLASDITMLAAVLRRDEQLDRAEPLLRQSLAIWEQQGIDADASFAHTLNQLGRLLWTRGRFDEAEPLLREGLRQREIIWGPNSLETNSSRGALAANLIRQGKVSEAIDLLETNYLYVRELLEPDHYYAAATASSLADALVMAGDYDRADTLYEEAQRITDKTLPPGHHRSVGPKQGWARMYMAKGQPEQAEPLFREVVGVLTAAIGADAFETALNKVFLAESLIELARYDEAEELLISSYETLKTTLGEDHRHTRRAQLALVNLYEATGNADEANRYRSELSSTDN